MNAASPVPTLTGTIQQQFALYANNRPQAQCVLLLDPTLRDAGDDADFAQCLEDWRENSGNDQPLPRILWRHPNLMPEHRPCMAALDPRREADAQLLAASLQFALDDWALSSLEQSRGHRICGWLFTQQDLAQYLGDLAVQRLPSVGYGSGKRTLLRYFDPSVLPALWRISDIEQQRTLLGPVDQWLALGRNGQLQRYQAVSGAAPLNDKARIDYSAGQWDAIQNIGALNQTIVQWQSNSEDGQPPQSASLEAVESALLRARRYGITDTQDLKAFAWHVLTVHPRFDMHSMIQQALKQLPAEKYYRAAVADLTEQDWRQVQLESTSR